MFQPWKPYVSVAARRASATRAMTKLQKKGRVITPVVIVGKVIATSFWGKSWCANLESYSDYDNRLPRGRTYARNGSIVDLQLTERQITAIVSGSELYDVTIKIKAVSAAKWQAICSDCTGAIDSLVELLQGHLSDGVMKRMCDRRTGLFPTANEIEFSCSCPDWAGMCKHVAAALYGVGARLDNAPALLCKLRQVDEKQLLVASAAGLATKPITKTKSRRANVIEGSDLSAMFGLDMAAPASELSRPRTRSSRRVP